MKIVITGTHLTPALAVIEEFKKLPAIDLIYIGRSSTMEGDKTKSVESEVFNNSDIKFLPLISGRFHKPFTFYTIFSLLKIPVGFVQAMYYLIKEEPDVILSFGGYISVPVVICSWLLNKKIIIHEQTLVFGLANTISSYFADKIAISFPQNKFLKKSNVIVTGNPIRKSVSNPKKSEDSDINKIIGLAKKEKKPLILITGGSQGSHVINLAVAENLSKLTEIALVVHQTGDSKYADFDKLLSLKPSLRNPERYIVKKWIQGEDFGFLLKNIDLAVSRSGMNTLQELAFYGIPTLSIPLPYLPKNEQTINARYFEKEGLVTILYQNELTPEKLIETIKSMFKDLENLKKRAKDAKNIIIPDASKRLVLETMLLEKIS